MSSQSPPTGPYAGPPPGGRPGPSPEHLHFTWAQQPNAAVPPRKNRTGLVIALVVGLVVLVCGGGIAGIYALAAAPGVQDGYRAAQPTTRAAPPVASRPASPAGPAVKPSPQIVDGTWTAGTDFPVGKYEVTSTNDLCAWQVYTGQEPNVHYVDPGHVGPGHYVFTFAQGQTLLTRGCGTWVKVG